MAESSDIAIRVENLGKSYRLGERDPHATLREVIRRSLRASVRKLADAARNGSRTKADTEETLWALRDVSFEVRRGEVLGIIGHNGAGKSTLLKILTRITKPTTGRAEIHGRVGSLLEVGTGFHPELTGRENIFLNGAILGMTRDEIRRKFDEIVEFSGVERFLDTPVKRFSSGMYVRLAFAVAAHLEPEILLIDEVLAVGDVAFQTKCLGKMRDVVQEGRTVLFVSHNMGAIARLCTQGILLSSGTCTHCGKIEDVITRYLQSSSSAVRSCVDLRETPRWDQNPQRIFTWISTHRLDGHEATDFATGDGMIIRVGYHLDQEVPAYCQINFLNFMGERVMTLRSTHNSPPLKISGNGFIQCTLHDLRLVSGEYTLMIETGRQFPQAEWLDCVPEATCIRVHLGNYLGGFELTQSQGVVAQRSAWSLAKTQDPRED